MVSHGLLMLTHHTDNKNAPFYISYFLVLLLTLTIPDATECNSLKKVMDVVALHFSGGCFKCVMLLHPELNCFV